MSQIDNNQLRSGRSTVFWVGYLTHWLPQVADVWSEAVKRKDPASLLERELTFAIEAYYLLNEQVAETWQDVSFKSQKDWSTFLWTWWRTLKEYGEGQCASSLFAKRDDREPCPPLVPQFLVQSFVTAEDNWLFKRLSPRPLQRFHAIPPLGLDQSNPLWDWYQCGQRLAKSLGLAWDPHLQKCRVEVSVDELRPLPSAFFSASDVLKGLVASESQRSAISESVDAVALTGAGARGLRAIVAPMVFQVVAELERNFPAHKVSEPNENWRLGYLELEFDDPRFRVRRGGSEEVDFSNVPQLWQLLLALEESRDTPFKRDELAKKCTDWGRGIGRKTDTENVLRAALHVLRRLLKPLGVNPISRRNIGVILVDILEERQRTIARRNQKRRKSKSR